MIQLREHAVRIVATVACLALIVGPNRGASQSAAAPLGIKLVTLGTHGGPAPDKDRAQSSNLLVVNGTLYLIDAGDGVVRRIVQAGYSFLKPRKVFITHDHSDHTLGLAVLLIDQWEQAPHDVTDVYGPPGTRHSSTACSNLGPSTPKSVTPRGEPRPWLRAFALTTSQRARCTATRTSR